VPALLVLGPCGGNARAKHKKCDRWEQHGALRLSPDSVVPPRAVELSGYTLPCVADLTDANPVGGSSQFIAQF